MSAKLSLDRYFARQLKEQERERGPTRKNQRPERAVQNAVIPWLKANGFECHVVDSRAVYSKRLQRYLHSQTVVGTPDLVGAGPGGIACYIELKSKGRRGTLRPAQREFLISKIKLGCFGVVVDSVFCLETIWNEFYHRRKMEPQLAVALLLRHLPPSKVEEFEP